MCPILKRARSRLITATRPAFVAAQVGTFEIGRIDKRCGWLFAQRDGTTDRQFSIEILENESRDVITDTRPKDVLLLYFEGHGNLDERNNFYFVARNTRRHRLRGGGIAGRFIRETMIRRSWRGQILIRLLL
jgi:hypothetical protein